MPDADTGIPRRQIILLVDDETDVRESLKALLETCLEDVEVRAAGDGPTALAMLERAKIDVIISDYKMPGMNGVDFLQRAQKMLPDVPRILVTAFPDLEVAIRAINKANIHNFFTKPFEPDEIVDVVRTLLRESTIHAIRNQRLARSMELVRLNRGSG